MINSRNINDLHPHVAKLCRQFIATCADRGIDVIITVTWNPKPQSTRKDEPHPGHG